MNYGTLAPPTSGSLRPAMRVFRKVAKKAKPLSPSAAPAH
jgi:hypothetical protein